MGECCLHHWATQNLHLLIACLIYPLNSLHDLRIVVGYFFLIQSEHLRHNFVLQLCDGRQTLLPSPPLNPAPTWKLIEVLARICGWIDVGNDGGGCQDAVVGLTDRLSVCKRSRRGYFNFGRANLHADVIGCCVWSISKLESNQAEWRQRNL